MLRREAGAVPAGKIRSGLAHREIAQVVHRKPVVESIAATTTETGLTVGRELGANSYIEGVKVTDAEKAALNIEGGAFHRERNCATKPRRREAAA